MAHAPEPWSGGTPENRRIAACDSCPIHLTYAADLAHKIAASGFDELAPFTSREAAFILSRLANMEPGKPVGTDFAFRVGIASRHEELTVHRVILR